MKTGVWRFRFAGNGAFLYVFGSSEGPEDALARIHAWKTYYKMDVEVVFLEWVGDAIDVSGIP